MRRTTQFLLELECVDEVRAIALYACLAVGDDYVKRDGRKVRVGDVSYASRHPEQQVEERWRFITGFHAHGNFTNGWARRLIHDDSTTPAVGGISLVEVGFNLPGSNKERSP